jgi:sugar phosphate isomerase/epimerase
MKNLSLILLLLVLTTSAGFAKKKKPLFPQVPGMCSYTYRNSFSRNFAATLDTLQQMGITDMEFSNLFGKKAAEIRIMLDERKMICSSFGVSYNDLKTKTREVGENAKVLGARFVRMAYITHEPPFTVGKADEAIEVFNNCGKILKEEFGITFCYHNHGYEFYPHENGTLMDYIIKNTNPEYVSFEIDILWTFFPGYDPAELISSYPDRFKLLHLKDLRKGVKGDLSGGTAVENDVALGTGQIDISSVLKAARKSGIEHYYIEDESPDYWKQVPQSLKYLKNLTF